MNEPNKHFDTPFGVHRLMKEPYDDREIFLNISDFINYINNKNNNIYSGQTGRIVIPQNGYDPNKPNTFINYTIIDDVPIFDLGNNELIQYTPRFSNQVDYATLSDYMLVYKTDKLSVFPYYNTGFTNLDMRGIYGFSMLDLIPAMYNRIDNQSNTNYKFILEIIRNNIAFSYLPRPHKLIFKFSISKNNFNKLMDREIDDSNPILITNLQNFGSSEVSSAKNFRYNIEIKSGSNFRDPGNVPTSLANIRILYSQNTNNPNGGGSLVEKFRLYPTLAEDDAYELALTNALYTGTYNTIFDTGMFSNLSAVSLYLYNPKYINIVNGGFYYGI